MQNSTRYQRVYAMLNANVFIQAFVQMRSSFQVQSITIAPLLICNFIVTFFFVLGFKVQTHVKCDFRIVLTPISSCCVPTDTKFTTQAALGLRIQIKDQKDKSLQLLLLLLMVHQQKP